MRVQRLFCFVCLLPVAFCVFYKRRLHVGLWGLTGGGVPMVFWFKFLDARWPGPPTFRKVISKVLVNQICAAPIMNSLFFGFTELMHSGHDGVLSRWKTKLERDLWPTIQRSFAFWAPAHVFNFIFVKPTYRVLYLSVGLVGWTAYLSITAYKKD
jgi:hypothetical protein